MSNDKIETSFIEDLFSFLWRRRRVEDLTEYPRGDFSQAVHILRQNTRLTIDKLAARAGVSPSTLAAIISRNGPMSQATCKRLEWIARDYFMPVLANWFNNEAFLLSRKRRVKTPQERPGREI